MTRSPAPGEPDAGAASPAGPVVASGIADPAPWHTDGDDPAPDAATAAYALRLGDDALVLAQRLSGWVSAAELEEDVALANIALDLLGQARTLLTYAGRHDGRTEDDLAYLRDEREFRNVSLVELPNGDFAATIARQLAFATYQHGLYDALRGSTDPTLAALAGKAVKEVAYHRDHAARWTLRLGDGTEESRRRMIAGLAAVWPHTAELFAVDDLVAGLAERGVAVRPDALRDRWLAEVGDVLARATLALPEAAARHDAPWRPAGGRDGVHTEGFGYLLAEMQSLARRHPGARW